jgi:hypothetical protein
MFFLVVVVVVCGWVLVGTQLLLLAMYCGWWVWM